MKTRTIVIILALILGIHGLVLYFVLRDKKGPEPVTEQIQKQGTGQETKPEARRAPRMTYQQYLMLQAREAITKPYDYRGSIEGAIPGLQAGKPGKAGILVDLKTRKVLWSKGAKTPVPIASMTKLMTVLVAYEMTLDKNSGVTLDTPVKVSVAAIISSRSVNVSFGSR